MFSIEHILEEIINFFKSFFYTIYVVILKPSKLLDKEDVKEKKIKASIYMILCAFLFLSMYHTTSNFWYATPNLQLSKYFGFFDEKLISERVLYIIPLGITIYAFIAVIGLLFKDQQRPYFKNMSYYWIGTALLGYIFLIFLYIVALMLLPEEPEYPLTHNMENIFYCLRTLIRSLWIICSVVPLVLSIISIRINNKTHKQPRLMFVAVPLIAAFSVFFCYEFLFHFLPHTELTKNKIVLMNLYGIHEINVDTLCDKSSCEEIEIGTNILIQNRRETPVILKKGCIFIKAWSDKIEDIGNDNQYCLNIEKMDNDSITKIRVLKPGDFVSIQCGNMIPSKKFQDVLRATQQGSEHSYQLEFDLPFYSTDPEERKNGLVEVMKVFVGHKF